MIIFLSLYDVNLSETLILYVKATTKYCFYNLSSWFQLVAFDNETNLWYSNTRLIYTKTIYNYVCFQLYFFHCIIEFNQETPWFYKYTTLLFCYKNVCLVSGFPSNNFAKMGTATTKLNTYICRTFVFLFLCPSRFITLAEFT